MRHAGRQFLITASTSVPEIGQRSRTLMYAQCTSCGHAPRHNWALPVNPLATSPFRLRLVPYTSRLSAYSNGHTTTNCHDTSNAFLVKLSSDTSIGKLLWDKSNFLRLRKEEDSLHQMYTPYYTCKINGCQPS